MHQSFEQIQAEYDDVRAVAELLPWMYPYDDRLIVNKDSSLMAVFVFEGQDIDGATVSEFNKQAEVANLGYDIFSNMPVTLWWQFRRREVHEYVDSLYPDAVSQRINDNRKQEFLRGRHYGNFHHLIVSLQPPAGAFRIADRMRHYMLNEGVSGLTAVFKAVRDAFSTKNTFEYSVRQLVDTVNRYEEALNSFTSALQDFSFVRLRGERLGGFLTSTSTPGIAPDAEIQLPADAPVLDSHLSGAYINVGHDFLHFTGQTDLYMSGLSIKKWPTDDGAKTVLGQLDGLLSLDGEITVTHMFRFEDQNKQNKHIDAVKNYNENTAYSIPALLGKAFRGEKAGAADDAEKNEGKVKRSKAADKAKSELGSSRLNYGWYHMAITCQSRSLNDLEIITTAVNSVMIKARLIPIRETIGLLSVFEATIPGRWDAPINANFLSNRNLTDLAPLRTISMGSRTNHYFTEQTKTSCPALAVHDTTLKTKYYFNYYVADLGHYFYVGPSRTGKTVAANFHIVLFRKYPNADVIILDKDHSSRIMVIACGGTYLDSASGKVKFAPMQLLSEGERGLKWLEGFISRLISSRGIQVTNEGGADIRNALLDLKRLGDENGAHHWTLGSLMGHLTIGDLQVGLAQWVGEGSYAHVFDNEEDCFDAPLTQKLLIGIDVTEWLKMPEIINPVADYLAYKVELRIADKRAYDMIGPTIMHYAEVAFLINQDAFMMEFTNRLKTWGKKMASIGMDTQSPDDLFSSVNPDSRALEMFLAAIRDNVATRIYSPNDKANNEHLKNILVRKLGLNPGHVERIRSGIPKRQYLIQQGQVVRMIDMQLDAETLAICRGDIAAQTCFDRWLATAESNPNYVDGYIKEITHA